uniref:Uncharacterized protein n=1 Tax=Lepeophtheirus salmonis TaxID=72036 RepID=A0A0K2TEP0_LEPSM
MTIYYNMISYDHMLNSALYCRQLNHLKLEIELNCQHW